MAADAISSIAHEALAQGVDTGSNYEPSSVRYLRSVSKEASRSLSLLTQHVGSVDRSELVHPQFTSLGAKGHFSANEAYANASNLNQLRVQFEGGSMLTAKAHAPGVSHRDDQGSHTAFKAMGAGLLAAAVAALLTNLTKERPKDAAFQGYTCEYAYPQGQSFGTSCMYAWIRSPSVCEQVSVYGSSESNRWPDFALDPPFDSNWWIWRAGQANLRTSDAT